MGFVSKVLRTFGLLGDPINPVSGKQVIARLVYGLLAVVSIWATAESFHTSLAGVPLVVCYIVGLLPIAMIALMLGAIKTAVKERKLLTLIAAFSFFSLMLAFSLSTNSHKFFTELKMYDIRKAELEKASNELTLLRKNSNSIAESIIEDYGKMVAGHIKNYAEEVANPANCGHGPEAQKLLRAVEESMPGSNFKLLSGYAQSGPSCRQLAQEMARIMTEELNVRLGEMRQNTLNMESCDSRGLNDQIIENLEVTINEYFVTSQVEVKKILSKAHQHYEQQHDCIKNMLANRVSNVDNADLDFPKKLEMPVASIELEKISALLPYVKTHSEYSSAFYLSVIIAVILDLGAIALFYMVILGKNDD
ncbi:MAG: hypothetical protein H6602_07610 [Flavobacteriales bacterium]|nr:hypothetical protein [Flavobacteriales bacterium]